MESVLNCLERWSPEAADIPEDLWSSVNTVCETASVPALQMSEDRPYEQADFQGSAGRALATLRAVRSVIQRLTEHKYARGGGGSKTRMKSFLVHVLLLCGEHVTEHPWTSSETCQLSDEVLSLLCALCSCGILSELLVCYNGGQGLIFKAALQMLRTKLLKDTWKKHPAAKYCYKWILCQVKHPDLGEHLSDVLPTALIFIDDYELENKILGVQCLQHIIENTNPTELRWHQRAEVVYDALEHLLYTREPELVPVLHPCLLRILQVVEWRSQKIDQSFKVTRYDKVLQLLLQDMELEQRISVRREYIQQLPPLVEVMGITAARWLQLLIRIIGNYMQVACEPEETTRKYALITLKVVISHTWPCVPHHCQCILEALLRLLYDITQASGNVAMDTSQEELLQLIAECLSLMQKAAPKKLAELCTGLQDIRLNEKFSCMVQTVLREEDTGVE